MTEQEFLFYFFTGFASGLFLGMRIRDFHWESIERRKKRGKK